MEREPNGWSLDRGYYYQDPNASGWSWYRYAIVGVSAAILTLLFMQVSVLGGAGSVRAADMKIPLAPIPEKTNPLFDSIASQIAKRPVKVACTFPENPKGIIGETEPGSDYIWMTDNMCGHLLHFQAIVRIRPDRTNLSEQDYDDILAMQVLAHESFHALGIKNERQTDCYAMQRVEFVALKLGASLNFAQSIEGTLVSNYNFIRRPTDAYRLGVECRNGGSLDLDPNTLAWPE